MSLPVAYQRGVDWANDTGPHHKLGIDGAIAAWGYGLFDDAATQFVDGATQAQREHGDECISGDAWADDESHEL